MTTTRTRTRKLAILQMADTPQIESTAVMLEHAGYEVAVCNASLRSALEDAGCDTVLAVSRMVSMGYDPLDPRIPEVGPEAMGQCDLFVEIKVRNVPKILARWPRLQGKVAWWRVNGAQPEICPKGGDEVNLPCPVITACLWYGTDRYRKAGVAPDPQGQSEGEHLASRPMTESDWRALAATYTYGDNGHLGYTFWPPYPRSKEYLDLHRGIPTGPPYCLAHSAPAWGYRPIIDDCVRRGIKIYGNNSPHGQVSHRQVAGLAEKSLALVHLKSVDCPGWALYEALLAGCPVITPRLMNSRMLAYDLLRHEETCYEFGVAASLEYGRGDMAYEQCLTDIDRALERLIDPVENKRIGEAGRQRLLELMWTPERHGPGFVDFMRRNFR